MSLKACDELKMLQEMMREGFDLLDTFNICDYQS